MKPFKPNMMKLINGEDIYCPRENCPLEGKLIKYRDAKAHASVCFKKVF